MDKKKQTLILVLVIVIVIIFFPTFFLAVDESPDNQSESAIGGTRDENGCLTPAGFSWDEELGLCLRTWELTDAEDRNAVKAVTALTGSYPGLTLIEIVEIGCPDCRLVLLERNNARVGITVRDGVVENRPITPLECVARDGIVRTPSNEAICSLGEYTVGAVDDGGTAKYCCYEHTL